jgi:hypothetical protein
MTDPTPKTTTKAATKTAYPNLASALVAFQSDIPVPTKDAENPHFKSSFASLDGITPQLTQKLSAVGIAWSARAGFQEGQYGLIGSLLHESGDTLDGFFPIPVTKPQDIGSAFAYARRYLLLALTGVAPTGEDDDGQKAQEAAAQKEVQVAQAQATAAAADTIAPLKKRVTELLTEAGELTPEMDQEARTAKVQELGMTFFGRAGWANSDIALKKWIAALENPEADPQTGEVKE